MNLSRHIHTNNLQPADVLVAKGNTGLGLITHYMVYVGNDQFMLNSPNKGVHYVTQTELYDLAQDYHVTGIKRFRGNWVQRKAAVRRAHSALGKSYSHLGYNCEHFANVVQTGRSTSSQADLGKAAAFIGTMFLGAFVVSRG